MSTLADAADVIRAADILRDLAKAKTKPKAPVRAETKPRKHALGRAPNRAEKDRGIPPNYRVVEIPRKNNPSKVDYYYYSPDRTKYRSAKEVKRALEEGSSSSDSSSDASSDSDEDMACEDDDDISDFNITLNIYVNGEPKPNRSYLPSTTAQQVIDDCLPRNSGGTLFYQGIGRDASARLQCILAPLHPGATYKVTVQNRPGMHTFVYKF